MKKLLSIIISFVLLMLISNTSYTTKVHAAVPTPDITSEFSYKMRKNALYMAYYALNDKTYPLGTGLEFASKVRPNGEWDYKRTYGAATTYIFGGMTVRGEDLGNMHYGYVGSAAGFSPTILKTAAGAVQIYSGTSYIGWYKTYFDDPRDQTFISKGINYWENGNLPTKSMSSLILQSDENKNFKTTFTDLDFNKLTEEEKEDIKRKAEENAKIVLEELNKNNK
jgi:hypothetical protein